MSEMQSDNLNVGILTGISYVSGIDYYKAINEQYTELVPGKIMNKNPSISMVSVDCDRYVQYLTAGDYAGVSEYLLAGVKPLVEPSDFLMIASNTGHIAYDSIRQAYPSLSILHIADCTARAIKKKGLRKVALVGTPFSMNQDLCLIPRLRRHGLEIITPKGQTTIDKMYDIICQELSFNKFSEDSRRFFEKEFESLAKQGAQGIILGCTEIELLAGKVDCAVPLFPSAKLHVQAGVDVMLRKAKLDDFEPETAANMILDSWGQRKGADSGDPQTSGRVLHKKPEDGVSVGIWECTPGGWPVVNRGNTETCHILKGKVIITSAGVRKEYGPGDVFVLPVGWTGRWDVIETVRKLYIVSDPPQSRLAKL